MRRAAGGACAAGSAGATMRTLTLAIAAACVAACQSAPQRPLPLAAHVDLARFMGDWHVIAASPTWIDAHAFDAVESYRLAADATVETTYTFRDGGFDGPQHVYRPRGFVRDRVSNAVWDMQFVWPFRADYRIAYVSADYRQVVIAREKRDYAWIMARSPSIPEADLLRHLDLLARAGYDTKTLRRVPQRPARPS